MAADWAAGAAAVGGWEMAAGDWEAAVVKAVAAKAALAVTAAGVLERLSSSTCLQESLIVRRAEAATAHSSKQSALQLQSYCTLLGRQY